MKPTMILLVLVAITVACPVARAQDGGGVLWDLTHGVFQDYDPDGRYSMLAGMLADAGLPVSVTNQGVDDVDLSPYGVLVISTSTAWNSPYTESEVAAITAFVTAGGGLLVMGDNYGTPASIHLNHLTVLYGSIILEVLIEPSDLFFSNLGVHRILAGVTEIYFGGCGALQGTAPSMEVAWVESGEAMVTVTAPERVVVLADCNWCQNSSLGYADNVTFAMNLFTWLADTPVRTENTSWSGVKDLFR